MVDEHLAHGPRGRREQVISIGELVEDRVTQEPDDSLVDHGGRRESVIGPLAAHET